MAKTIIKNLLKSVFYNSQKLGVNILPNHYYSNIPNFGILNKEEYWKQASSMTGVSGTDTQMQLSFLQHCMHSLEDKSLLKNSEILNQAIKDEQVAGYGVIEADFLFCFINHLKPRKVVQIGCGVSTSIILRASKHADASTKITCVEPFPSQYLKDLERKKEIRLIPEIAQTVDINELLDLDEGDLLFVDSTHTVKPGSEVNRIILEVLPRLKKGVYVHFHDINFPFDYQRDFNSTLFFWNESTLLHAFLINNSRYSILVSLSMLHYAAKEKLKENFPNYDPQKDDNGLQSSADDSGKHYPSSIFLRVV